MQDSLNNSLITGPDPYTWPGDQGLFRCVADLGNVPVFLIARQESELQALDTGLTIKHIVTYCCGQLDRVALSELIEKFEHNGVCVSIANCVVVHSNSVGIHEPGIHIHGTLYLVLGNDGCLRLFFRVDYGTVFAEQCWLSACYAKY